MMGGWYVRKSTHGVTRCAHYYLPQYVDRELIYRVAACNPVLGVKVKIKNLVGVDRVEDVSTRVCPECTRAVSVMIAKRLQGTEGQVQGNLSEAWDYDRN